MRFASVRTYLGPIFAIIFAIIVFFIIPSQIKDTGVSFTGPRFYPYFLTVSILVLGIISIIVDLSKRDKKESASKSGFNKYAFMRVLLSFIILIAWVYILPILGFVISTVLLTIGLTFIIEKRKLYQVLIVSILFTVVIYFIFRTGLKIPLPKGIFF